MLESNCWPTVNLFNFNQLFSGEISVTQNVQNTAYWNVDLNLILTENKFMIV